MCRKLFHSWLLLSCQLVYRKVPLCFHDKWVTKCLDLLSWYRVIHCVVRHLDFIFKRGSIKVCTKSSVFILVTPSFITLNCTSFSLRTKLYICASFFFLNCLQKCLNFLSCKLLSQLVKHHHCLQLGLYLAKSLFKCLCLLYRKHVR